MRRAAVYLVSVATASTGSAAWSHGGGLNAEGCHTNRKTGEYHCHRAPRASSPPRLAPRAGPDGRSCGEKMYCTQMRSCEEAMFHFSQCGLSRLDGDDDGVPCESLCR